MFDEHQQVLWLLAHLPLAPLRVLVPLAGSAASTLQRHTRGLIERGLVGAVSDCCSTNGRPAGLLYLTRLGLDRDGVEPVVLARQLGASGGKVTRRCLDALPGLLAAYELLGLLAGCGPDGARLCSWQRPWRRVLAARPGDRRVLRLPAAARLAWTGPGAETPLLADYLLLPDTGGLAMPAFRTAIGRLAEYQAHSSATRSVLAIATTTSRRAAGWVALMESVCHSRGLPLLESHISTWTDLRHKADRVKRETDHSGARRPIAGVRPVAPRTPTTVSDKPCRVPQPVQAFAGDRLSQSDRAILDLVARHPFLPTRALAELLGHDVRWARSHCRALVEHGLLRLAQASEVVPPVLARLSLLEATRAGLTTLAALLDLPLMSAVHHHGLAGGGPEAALGPRAALVDHLSHTLGADAVVVALGRAARAHPSGAELIEWRGPGACAHGRLRPDGYGLLRLGRQQFGFFLEFDRSSMHAGRLRAKFAAYHRYARSASAARSYAGFPTILVISTDPGGEQRLARAVAAAEAGQGLRLPVLLSTTGWLETAPAGPLGPIWRTPTESSRRAWPAL